MLTTKRGVVAMSLALVVLLVSPALAADNNNVGPLGNWLDLGQMMSGSAAAAAPDDGADSAPAVKGPPLPLMCIEGYGGGAITPTAYLVNPGAPGAISSLPTPAFTFIDLGSKELYVFGVTHVLFNIVELGYAYNHLDLGSLYTDIRRAGLNMGRDHVNLHHFNLRVNFIKENSFDLPLPAVTAGIHLKYNDSMERIDGSLGGAFKNIGWDHSWGIDYTVTATKMFPTLAFGRPVILTGGLRFSNAAQLGYLGFGGQYHVTFEGSVLVMPLDNVVLAYEFRMKHSPYPHIRTSGGKTLVGEEDHWHMFSATWVVTNRLTVTGMVGLLGNVVNARADGSVGVQVKYEF